MWLALGASVVLAGVPVAMADLGLRDHPIASAAAAAPHYLDGAAWTASTRLPSPPGVGNGLAAGASNCSAGRTWQVDTDYHDGQGLGSARGSGPGDCCSQCASAEWVKRGCRYFTWAPQPPTCWFKADNHNPVHSPGAISGGSYPPVPAPIPAPPIVLSVKANVPGDLLTDLQKAGVIADPWLDLTWLQNSSLWTDHAWTFSTNFTVSPSATTSSSLLLVLEGVKMGATVRVNGKTVGVVRDQFLRYLFPLGGGTASLLPGKDGNRLEIMFGDCEKDTAEDVAEDGRFMACTGVRPLTIQLTIDHRQRYLASSYLLCARHWILTVRARYRGGTGRLIPKPARIPLEIPQGRLPRFPRASGSQHVSGNQACLCETARFKTAGRSRPRPMLALVN